ncbi:MAG: hypothetical protein U9N76_08530 [Candidatus Marinimicrobia bacterium]|nr:hypothetical protein [Candidatus Neomarinimicrobiota bacterium]
MENNSKNIFQTLGMTKQNMYIFLMGILTIIVGYILLAIGKIYDDISMIYSPILLALGYIVILPLSILYRTKDK